MGPGLLLVELFKLIFLMCLTSKVLVDFFSLVLFLLLSIFSPPQIMFFSLQIIHNALIMISIAKKRPFFKSSIVIIYIYMYTKVKRLSKEIYYEVMIKSVTNVLIIFFIFQQLKSQIKLTKMDITRFAWNSSYIKVKRHTDFQCHVIIKQDLYYDDIKSYNNIWQEFYLISFLLLFFKRT